MDGSVVSDILYNYAKQRTGSKLVITELLRRVGKLNLEQLPANVCG